MYRRVAIVLCLLAGVACATPAVSPLGAGPITPRAGEKVVVDHAYLIIDSSSSVEAAFAAEKALVQSFVGAMPDGTYESGSTAFGGYDRANQSLEKFNRSKFQAGADAIPYFSEGTPIDRVIGEVGTELAGKSGRAAVVIWSDGEPTDPSGRSIDEQKVLDAAGNLSKAYNGPVCIHTVQVGDSPGGAALLKKLANTNDCGTTRSASAVQNVAALQNFEREVFLGAGATPSVAAAPGDADGDGVIDSEDQCPGTPVAAKVDERGCWTIPGLNFAHDSATIESQYQPELNDLVRVLNENPGLNLQIEGHTDSDGANNYNEGLSQRRATSVRKYLVKSGVGGTRLSTKGFGEERPAYPNDTPQNKRGNRRTELSAQK